MGLCASQARLLMLTARKDDLEFRMQQITNDKQTLARQQEGIAAEYNNSLSNRCFKDIESGVELTSENIMNYMPDDVTDLKGDPNQIRKIFGYDSVTTDDDGNVTGFKLNSTQLYRAFSEGYLSIQFNKEATYNGVEYESGSYYDLSSATGINDSYYTEDDGKAESAYEAAMAKVKTKEQKLDLEAEQLETQYTAVTTEIESVQNIVKKEVEGGFKYFS